MTTTASRRSQIYQEYYHLQAIAHQQKSQHPQHQIVHHRRLQPEKAAISLLRAASWPLQTPPKTTYDTNSSCAIFCAPSRTLTTLDVRRIFGDYWKGRCHLRLNNNRSPTTCGKSQFMRNSSNNVFRKTSTGNRTTPLTNDGPPLVSSGDMRAKVSSVIVFKNSSVRAMGARKKKELRLSRMTTSIFCYLGFFGM